MKILRVMFLDVPLGLAFLGFGIYGIYSMITLMVDAGWFDSLGSFVGGAIVIVAAPLVLLALGALSFGAVGLLGAVTEKILRSLDPETYNTSTASVVLGLVIFVLLAGVLSDACNLLWGG